MPDIVLLSNRSTNRSEISKKIAGSRVGGPSRRVRRRSEKPSAPTQMPPRAVALVQMSADRPGSPRCVYPSSFKRARAANGCRESSGCCARARRYAASPPEIAHLLQAMAELDPDRRCRRDALEIGPIGRRRLGPQPASRALVALARSAAPFGASVGPADRHPAGWPNAPRRTNPASGPPLSARRSAETAIVAAIAMRHPASRASCSCRASTFLRLRSAALCNE